MNYSLKNIVVYAMLFCFYNTLQCFTTSAETIKVRNPTNGHYYQRFDQAMSWDEAVLFCKNQGANLVTITSEDENLFVLENFNPAHDGLANWCWLGATDRNQEGEWEWITGEKWNYTNWNGGEPSNATQFDPNGEDYVHIFAYSNGKWNDVHGSAIYPSSIDVNHVPICEWDETDEEVAYCSETGHYYSAIHIDEGINWNKAKELSENTSFIGLSGHLATITSQKENDCIYNSLGSELLAGYWLGGIQPEGSNEPNGNWQWVTNETWDFTNWGQGEPNNGVHAGINDEEALQFHPTSSPPYTWNDLEKTALMPGFVVEYETANDNNDCNILDDDDDGVIDQWDNCSNTPKGSIVNNKGCPVQGLYTEDQMDQMVNSILSWGDLNGDNRISLIEAIKALRISSGVTEPSLK